MNDKQHFSLPDIAAHRGGSRYPENSLSGFRHAASYGVEQVELDVHLTSDDQLLVMHDETLDQTSFGSGPISAFTLAEIQASRLRQIDESAPSLDQALAAVAPSGMRVRIEVKPGGSPGGYEKTHRLAMLLIDKHRMGDRVTIMSFDPAALAYFTGSGVPTSLSVWPSAQASLETFRHVVAQAAAAGIDDLGLSHGRTTPAMLALAAEAGLTAGLWTVNDASRLDYWLRQPVAYILTDHPDIAKRVRDQLQGVAGDV
jgi:glycerophosphoryl diester phosphodiesterase